MLMRPALFVQDIQNFWLYEPDSNQALRRSVEKRLEVINEVIAWFREKKLPIIVGYTVEEERGLIPGTKSFEVPESVRIEGMDIKVTKLHSNAFGNPELSAILREQGCDSMAIVGLSASGCVLATYFSAPDHGIRAFLIEGGVASHDEEHVRFAEEICETVSLEELDSMVS
jgi:nicotinamidase-related amidase